ncbi:MAG TPA: response regulator [Planctomycetaceae bacterium]
MPKRVLSVGQCVPDGTAIKSFLKQRFGAVVQAADTADEAMAMLHNGPFDLVLVNRVFDADGGSGLELVRAVKANPTTGKIPVMLVSNYAEAQQKAVEHGAEPGFGKAQLGSEEVVERLTPFLRE